MISVPQWLTGYSFALNPNTIHTSDRRRQEWGCVPIAAHAPPFVPLPEQQDAYQNYYRPSPDSITTGQRPFDSQNALSNDSLLMSILESKPARQPLKWDSFNPKGNIKTISPSCELKNELQICHMASEIVTRTVNFVKGLAAFNDLPFCDQMRLFRKCWAQLFIVGLAQSGVHVALSTILRNICQHRDSQLSESSKIISLIERCSKLNLTDNEYAYFKGIVLFNPDMANLRNRAAISELQTDAQQALFNYTCTVLDRRKVDCIADVLENSEGETQLRRQLHMSHILLSLPALRSVNHQVVVNMFFRHVSDSTAIIENMLVELLVS